MTAGEQDENTPDILPSGSPTPSAAGIDLSPAELDGLTATERILKRLGQKAFLSLWGYVGLHKDQGLANGQELCDFLVVFDKHVLIFSVKDCAFGSSSNIHRDWARWCKRAVLKSANQVWGAERWIRQFPQRIFLDRDIVNPFPLPLPNPADAKYHRIVVAYGAGDRCREEVGGSGSLAIDTSIVGLAHTASPADGGRPLVVGNIDPNRGFIHVFDDASLEKVFNELDTISDFVTYLEAKERLLTSGTTVIADGEEDLLAEYLFPKVGKTQHRFPTPSCGTLTIPSGRWKQFESDRFRAARVESNRVSYFWDSIIERSAEAAFGGKEYYATTPGVTGAALCLRPMAAESRTRRRMLSQSLLSLATAVSGVWNYRAVRVGLPSQPGHPHYAFLAMSPSNELEPEHEYREHRRLYLEGLCDVVKDRYAPLGEVVGIATELGKDAGTSQDIVLRDATPLTAGEVEAARAFASAERLLVKPTISSGTEYDYPAPGMPPSSQPFRGAIPKAKGRDRNKPCLCGSGRKLKNCCGRSLTRARASARRDANAFRS